MSLLLFSKIIKKKIPASTLLSLTGGTPSASSNWPGLIPANAFDGLSSTRWSSANSTLPHYIQYQLAQAKTVTRYRITMWDSMDTYPTAWQFQGSNNGSSWTTLDAQTSISGWVGGGYKEYSFVNATPYLYYRLNITASNDNWGALGDLSFYGY